MKRCTIPLQTVSRVRSNISWPPSSSLGSLMKPNLKTAYWLMSSELKTFAIRGMISYASFVWRPSSPIQITTLPVLWYIFLINGTCCERSSTSPWFMQRASIQINRAESVRLSLFNAASRFGVTFRILPSQSIGRRPNRSPICRKGLRTLEGRTVTCGVKTLGWHPQSYLEATLEF